MAYFVFALLLSWIWLVNPASAGAITVRSGQSIQAAIDRSHAGDLILVTGGTYAEQLTIKRSGTSLIGYNAILIPPKNPVKNICSGLAGEGTQAGICITGTNVTLAPFVFEHSKVISVTTRVSNVLVTGFAVRNFSGIDIAVVGAENAIISNNRLRNGAQYGALAVGSTNTRIDRNIINFTRELGFIGICVDDVGGAQVTNNAISGYSVGLCVQTPGADVRHNAVTNSCFGAFIDPGIEGAEISHNHIFGPANPVCAGSPDLGVLGIIIVGAIDTEVSNNLIEGLHTPDKTGRGIVVVDFGEPPAVATNNTIEDNVLRNNDIDIFLNTTGKGNVIQGNTCTTPVQLCS